MFQKMKMKNKIKKCRKEILKIEQKRERSQSVLVEAILSHKTPDDEDVSYFNMYTAQISAVRDQMHDYEKQLTALENK